MNGRDMNTRVKRGCCARCHLKETRKRDGIRVQTMGHWERVTTYQSLTLLHVLLSEQKLTVKVGKVDGVEIEQGNVTESGKDDVLDCKRAGIACRQEDHVVLKQDGRTKFATDTTGPYYEDLHIG